MISADDLAALLLLCAAKLSATTLVQWPETTAARGGSQEGHRMVLQSGFPASGAGQKPLTSAPPSPCGPAPPCPAAERRPLPCGPGEPRHPDRQEACTHARALSTSGAPPRGGAGVRISAEELAALSAHIFRGNAPVSRDSRQTVAPNTRASDPDPADGSKTAAATSQRGAGPGHGKTSVAWPGVCVVLASGRSGIRSFWQAVVLAGGRAGTRSRPPRIGCHRRSAAAGRGAATLADVAGPGRPHLGPAGEAQRSISGLADHQFEQLRG